MRAEWLKERIQRHLGALIRLAWPTALSRLGIIAMVMVDTMMVGRYGTEDLAYLNIGNGTMVAVFIVIAVGLLMGTLVCVADAHGRKDLRLCGRVWRRSLSYAWWLGVAFAVFSFPGEFWLTLFGQTEEVARQGGAVMRILSFGLPGYMIYLTSIFFLEGIERPKVGMYLMLAANILNIGFNYVLVFGHFGAPELGAQGSAWATTILRNFLGAGILIYILLSSGLKPYGVREKAADKWRDWQRQRMIGYAAGASLGAEVIAFAAFNVFSGWLGTLSLAAYGVILNIISAPFMLAAGIGSATAVRVGIAKSRNDRPDVALAGWTGLALSTLVLGVVGSLLFAFATPILSVYSDDLILIAYSVPLAVFTAYVLVVDGDQAVLSNALRGLGETWIPTAIQSIAYFIFMIPLGYFLAVYGARDVRGLLEAILIASIVSVALQAAYFHNLTRAGAK